MLFPKIVSLHKKRLAQIKVAVDSICTPPSIIPHNLNPTLPMESKKNFSKPKTCINVFKNKTKVVVAFQMA
jgi:hypothetical protein